MRDINEIIKDLTTADNSDHIIELQQAVKGIIDNEKAKDEELSKLKDKFINVVNNYGYVPPSNNEEIKPVEDEPMSIDEAIVKAFEEVNKK